LIGIAPQLKDVQDRALIIAGGLKRPGPQCPWDPSPLDCPWSILILPIRRFFF